MTEVLESPLKVKKRTRGVSMKNLSSMEGKSTKKRRGRPKKKNPQIEMPNPIEKQVNDSGSSVEMDVNNDLEFYSTRCRTIAERAKMMKRSASSQPPSSLSFFKEQAIHSRKPTWSENYEKLKKFYQRNPNWTSSQLRIEDLRLWNWVRYQKRLLMNQTLSKENYQLLREIGVCFDQVQKNDSDSDKKNLSLPEASDSKEKEKKVEQEKEANNETSNLEKEIHCIVCKKSKETGNVKWISCGRCGDTFHFECLSPPLTKAPTRWFCFKCDPLRRKTKL